MPVESLTPGVVETVQIEIGYPYVNQVYYNCESNQVVKANSKCAWDLSFEESPEGYHVLLNTDKGEFLANMGNVDFAKVTNIDNAVWLWDAPSGNLDSTAVGDWRGKNEVYILDLQFNEMGVHNGYKKIQMVSSNNNFCIFKHANLNGSEEKTDTLYKNQDVNFVHFSFVNGVQLLEPNKNNWDLLFTNHYHKFSNLPMPFVLTQVLSNVHNGVLVAEDNNNNFFNITLKDTANYMFTNNWDEVGYDWKIRNGADNSFTIDPDKSFIVRTAKGLFYKMRFIDFYNDSGVKGYPKFEIQKL